MKIIIFTIFAVLMLGIAFREPDLAFLGSAGIAGFLAAAEGALNSLELLFLALTIGGFWSILNGAAWPAGIFFLGIPIFTARYLPGRFLYLAFWPERLLKGLAAGLVWGIGFGIRALLESGKAGLTESGLQALAFLIYFMIFALILKAGSLAYASLFRKT